MMNKIARKHRTNEMEEVNHYRNPQHRLIKFNFYMLMKENQGEANIGIVFRDHNGTTLTIYSME